MKKMILKKVAALALAISILPSLFAGILVANAENVDSLLWDNRKDEIQDNTGLGNTDPRDIVANVIRVILGFLGIVAVIIVIIGGFKWMTSAGNEEKTAEARNLIVSGFVGLLIILAAFGIASFVIEKIYDVTANNQ